jgi:hypothetical protein
VKFIFLLASFCTAQIYPSSATGPAPMPECIKDFQNQEVADLNKISAWMTNEACAHIIDQRPRNALALCDKITYTEHLCFFLLQLLDHLQPGTLTPLEHSTIANAIFTFFEPQKLSAKQHDNLTFILKDLKSNQLAWPQSLLKSGKWLVHYPKINACIDAKDTNEDLPS